MAKKCRRGQHLMKNGECMSEGSMRKMLRNAMYSDDWQQGGQIRTCLVPDSWSERPGIAVTGKGASVRLQRSGRSWTSKSRCVFPKHLTPTEIRALSNEFLGKR